jgi:hypothetical protein
MLDPRFKVGDKIKIIKEWSSIQGVSELVGQYAIITKMDYLPHDQWHYQTNIDSWYIPEDCIEKAN